MVGIVTAVYCKSGAAAASIPKPTLLTHQLPIITADETREPFKWRVAHS